MKHLGQDTSLLVTQGGVFTHDREASVSFYSASEKREGKAFMASSRICK